MKYIYLVILFLTTTVVASKELKSVAEAKNLAKEVMSYVEKGESAKGLLLFKPYLIIPEAEFDVMLNSLKMQQPIMDQRFGKTIGIEYIGEKTVGKSLMKITYAEKFEKHMMRWVFYFYKPKDRWVMNTFTTDDNIKALFY